MLYRASVADLRSGRVDRQSGYVVITMRYYPRFVRQEWRDEYVRDMAPDPELFGEFKSTERRIGSHNNAFDEVHYEARFHLTEAGQAHLNRLSGYGGMVWLVCQCSPEQRCHVDLLLIAAAHLYQAKTQPPAFDYPVWRDRVSRGDL